MFQQYMRQISKLIQNSKTLSTHHHPSASQNVRHQPPKPPPTCNTYACPTQKPATAYCNAWLTLSSLWGVSNPRGDIESRPLATSTPSCGEIRARQLAADTRAPVDRAARGSAGFLRVHDYVDWLCALSARERGLRKRAREKNRNCYLPAAALSLFYLLARGLFEGTARHARLARIIGRACPKCAVKCSRGSWHVSTGMQVSHGKVAKLGEGEWRESNWGTMWIYVSVDA